MPAATSIATEVPATSVLESSATIEPYSTLINKRILLPSRTANYIVAETHFLVVALRAQVEQIFLDEKWYLAQYPDIGVAIKAGTVENAREHYALHGFYEHRLPYAIAVDEAWYLGQYEDLHRAVREGVFASGQAHFEAEGYREGRLPFANFRLKGV